MNSQDILNQTKVLLESVSGHNLSQKLYEICSLLYKEVDHYDWVGFYFADASAQTLHLGPFAGEPTDHKVIPFGKGICGQVATSNQTFLVEDVHAQDNYIACSLNVKSEIVVPLFVDGQNVGQIDIDSNQPSAFEKIDEKILIQINEMLSQYIQQYTVDLKSLWV